MKTRAFEYLWGGFIYGAVFGGGIACLVAGIYWLAIFCLVLSSAAFLLVNIVVAWIEAD